MPKKSKTKTDLPKVHKDLNGLDVVVNSFGEIQMSLDINKINEFLNKQVDDKKLKPRVQEDTPAE